MPVRAALPLSINCLAGNSRLSWTWVSGGCPTSYPYQALGAPQWGVRYRQLASNGCPRLLCGKGRRRPMGASTPSIAGERFVLEAIESRTPQASQLSLLARSGECDVRQLWDDAIAEAIPKDADELTGVHPLLHHEPPTRGPAADSSPTPN